MAGKKAKGGSKPKDGDGKKSALSRKDFDDELEKLQV